MDLTTAFPDVRRADAGTALISSWIVPEPADQIPAADAVLDVWNTEERPDAMLSLTTFLGADGRHVLNYAQWTDDEAHREWVRTRRPAAIGRVDAAIPGIRRPGLVRYRAYRSHVPERTSGQLPTLMVTPTFTTTGPAAQRALADAVIDALARERVPGLLGAHFHLSQDGGQVLNYAEWEGMAAWQAFAENGTSERLQRVVAALEGVSPAPAAGPTPASAGVAHYRLHKSLVNVAPPADRATASA